MSKFKPRDYRVRVCDDGAVFIEYLKGMASGYIEYNNSHDGYLYDEYDNCSYGHIEEYLKLNTNDKIINDKVMNLCNNIATQLIELNDILNDIENKNEENGE